MVFGVARDLDVEPVAGALADERHQLVGVAKFSGGPQAGGQIAAKRDDVANAVALVALELHADVVARRGDAGDVRRGLVAGLHDVEHRL